MYACMHAFLNMNEHLPAPSACPHPTHTHTQPASAQLIPSPRHTHTHTYITCQRPAHALTALARGTHRRRDVYTRFAQAHFDARY